MRALVLSMALPVSALAQTRVDWPVFGGNTDNTHHSTLSQITPANVSRLKVAWIYETRGGGVRALQFVNGRLESTEDAPDIGQIRLARAP